MLNPNPDQNGADVIFNVMNVFKITELQNLEQKEATL
jgi:hypothetical protein